MHELSSSSNSGGGDKAPAATILQLFREKRAERQRLTPESRTCWLCCVDTGVVAIDGKDLCLYCGCELVMDVLLPRMERVMTNVELAVAEELASIEQREKNGEVLERTASSLFVSPPTSPKGAAPPQQAPPSSDWSCCRCTLLNTVDSATCIACGSPQPLAPECPHCGKDYTVKALCANMQPHQKWRCGHCDCENIAELVECRSCRKQQTWFCGQCSMENPMSEQSCLACDGMQHLSSLKSFVNRDMMTRAGLSIREMEAERRTLQEANEHRERLEHRLGCMTTARPVAIADDGNCLFRALAWQLLRDDTLYPLIRHVVVEHLVLHQDHYSAFVGSEGAFAKYVAGMRQAQVWGDELCVHAAGKAFPHLKIHVATSDATRWRLTYAKVKEAPAARHILLAYRAPNHYYTVAPVRDADIPAIDLPALLSGLTQAAAIASHIKITLQGAAPSVVPPLLKRGGPATPSFSAATAPPPDDDDKTRKNVPERPSTASRGSRSGDFLQLALLSMQEHAVVVTVRMGSNNDMALCVGGEVRKPDAVTVSQKSSFFYLHHVPREQILLVGPSSGLFGSIYDDVLAETMAPSYLLYPPSLATAPPLGGATAPPISPTASAATRRTSCAASSPPRPPKKRDPLFLLQEVSSGMFLGFRKSAVVTFDDVQRPSNASSSNSSNRSNVRRRVAPLCTHAPPDLSDCLLTIAEPRSMSTNELRFYKTRDESMPAYICETGTPGEIVAASTPTLPTGILVQLIFAGRCERLCVKCHQWFVIPSPTAAAGAVSDRSGLEVLGGCQHVSHADAIALQVKQY